MSISLFVLASLDPIDRYRSKKQVGMAVLRGQYRKLVELKLPLEEQE